MVWRILAFTQNCLETCRATHTFSGKNVDMPKERSFWQYADISYSRGFAGEWVLNESAVVENCDFRFFRSLSSERFTHMATRQLSRDATRARACVYTYYIFGIIRTYFNNHIIRESYCGLIFSAHAWL